MTTASRTTTTSIRTLPRWAWRMVIVYISLILISYFFALPVRLSQLVGNPNLTPILAIFQLVVDYLLIIATSGLGLILVRRRYNEYIAVLMSMALVVVLPNIPGISYLSVQLHPLFHIPAALAIITTASIAFLLLISLPDGYARPRKLVWVVPLMLVADSIRYVFLFLFPPPNALTIRAFAIIPNFILIAVALFAMRHRYKHHATPIQRQQFKWLFLGLTAEVTIAIFNQTFRVIIILLEGNVAISQLIISFTGTIGGIILCISLVLAISRYGLWDVDLTINRSMVAGFVTITLMIIFAIIFWIAQTALTALLGESRSEIAIAISALVIGISFNPVRNRVRTFVDRRLYGFRFDLNQLRRHQAQANAFIPGALTGKTLGGYQLLGILGRGNMGEVYRGVKDNQSVAIKIMHVSSSQDEKNMRLRFQREGKIVLNHPNIVQTLGAGEENGIFYILMEYVDGITIKELLAEREALPLADIMPYLRDLADAIDYAHAQGYVHRDIKPSNIM
ncbi:MAG: serine/threonine protein kinase, partial [Anaerolineae bacterium]|nr:serine/threonine protein kinase [Anaerolineae bacterium]